MNFERWTAIRPAYDCLNVRPCHFGKENCKPNSGGFHGLGSVVLTFYVADAADRNRGVVQFQIFTGWMLDDTPKKAWGHAMASDLGYHAPTPQYESQPLMADDCEVLGGACYYDGSGLNAEFPWHLLRHKGGDEMWTSLEDYWTELFDGGPKRTQAFAELLNEFRGVL